MGGKKCAKKHGSPVRAAFLRVFVIAGVCARELVNGLANLCQALLHTAIGIRLLFFIAYIQTSRETMNSRRERFFLTHAQGKDEEVIIKSYTVL